MRKHVGFKSIKKMQERKSMESKEKPKLRRYLNVLEQPMRLKPFVFSRTFLLWALLGLLGGSIAAAYWILLSYLMEVIAIFSGWAVIPVMALSGLLAGLVIHLIGDPGEIDLIVNNIRFKKGELDPKNNPSMLLSSLLCIASGGSLGPEAPMVQITGSMGTWLGKRFRLKGEAMRSVSIAGMASGFTALFGTPLGGSLFALEVLHHKYVVEYYQALIPAFVASCFSYVVFAIITHLGLAPIWQLPAHKTLQVFDFAYAVCFGVVATLVGWGFIFFVKLVKPLFERLPAPIYIKMLIGGLILGIIAFYLPLTRYFGDHRINEVLHSSSPWQFLLLILVFKLIAITVTVTSGWRGGFIIPLFFVGAVLGVILHHFFPGVSLSLAVVSCMAAINACVTRTPMSTTILLAALTGFSYLIPLLFASLTGYFLAPRVPFIKSQLEPSHP